MSKPRSLNLVAAGIFWLSWPLLWVYIRNSNRARVLLVCGDELLLVQGWLGTGRWALPGGGLHRGEDPREAAIREVREETGIQLHLPQLELLQRATTTQHGISYKYHAYLATVTKKPTITHKKLEISGVRWISPAKLADIPTEQVVTDVVNVWRLRG